LPDNLDLRWVPLLDALRLNWVNGRADHRPGADTDRWDRTAAALDAIGRYLGISRDRVPDDPDGRRVHILLCILRGYPTWYGSRGTDADRARAAAWFRAASAAAGAGRGPSGSARRPAWACPSALGVSGCARRLRRSGCARVGPPR
jgi:hypothetical protein